MNKLKVHMFSETFGGYEATGVHTAYIDLIEILREQNDVEVIENNDGWGDIFHSHTYGPMYWWKGRKYKGKRIFTAHIIPDSAIGTVPFLKQFYPFLKWYLRKVYSHADVCIAISPMVETAIRELTSKPKVVRLPNPVPIERWKFSEVKRKIGREKLGIDNEQFIVLGVGQLQGRKGVDDFIDIAMQIPEATFIWAGGRPFGAFTEGVSRINQRIATAPKNVKFIGTLPMNEMINLYSAGDMMLFPSFQENCPLAPLEATACGMPVVYRDLKEYQTLFENPYLKAKDKEEFISMTRKLMNDKTFFEDSKKVSNQLITQFDKVEIRKKYMELYHELAKA